MILFSQGPTSHSRLANSLLWMAKSTNFLSVNNFEYFFPWAYQNFNFYLSDDSTWLLKRNSFFSNFSNIFNIELTAENLSQISRVLEMEFLAQNLEDSTNQIIYHDKLRGLLFLRGKINFTDPAIIELIKSVEFTICHEPYDCDFGNEDINQLKIDCCNLIPKSQLFVDQLIFTNSKSEYKRKVGLHIRRGDYLNWQNGIYFYDDNYWLRLVEEITNDQTKVWIFSNELSDDFAQKLLHKGVVISNGSFVEDFVRMMFMSEISGPPSTFPPMSLYLARSHYKLNNKFNYLPPIK
jgi:hypothetical protein